MQFQKLRVDFCLDSGVKAVQDSIRPFRAGMAYMALSRSENVVIQGSITLELLNNVNRHALDYWLKKLSSRTLKVQKTVYRDAIHAHNDFCAKQFVAYSKRQRNAAYHVEAPARSIPASASDIIPLAHDAHAPSKHGPVLASGNPSLASYSASASASAPAPAFAIVPAREAPPVPAVVPAAASARALESVPDSASFVPDESCDIDIDDASAPHPEAPDDDSVLEAAASASASASATDPIPARQSLKFFAPASARPPAQSPAPPITKTNCQALVPAPAPDRVSASASAPDNAPAPVPEAVLRSKRRATEPTQPVSAPAHAPALATAIRQNPSNKRPAAAGGPSASDSDNDLELASAPVHTFASTSASASACTSASDVSSAPALAHASKRALIVSTPEQGKRRAASDPSHSLAKEPTPVTAPSPLSSYLGTPTSFTARFISSTAASASAAKCQAPTIAISNSKENKVAPVPSFPSSSATCSTTFATIQVAPAVAAVGPSAFPDPASDLPFSLAQEPTPVSAPTQCIRIQGTVNKPKHTKVVSPITWLLQACLDVGLISQTHPSSYSDPEETIARWPRDQAYTTKERFKTRGGITEADFWPKVLKMYPQSKSSAVFTDFGSEYFFQGLLCALLGDFQEVVGIELDEESFEKSVQLAKHFVNKAETENKFISNIMLIRGDFLKHDAVANIIARSTIVYANNVVFEETTNIALATMWRNSLPADAVIAVFDETAMLSSGQERHSRHHGNLDWASKEQSIETKVSWQHLHSYPIHLWRVLKQKPADKKAMSRHTHLQSELSDLVFTPLSDAIGEWEGTRNSKARDDLRFNILATVRKWKKPKESKGENSSNIFAQKTNMWFEGSDIHVAAQLMSNERDRSISASFFFDPEKCPKILAVGDKVRLIGTRLQMWKGGLHLTGKNIRFGHSCVSMSLSNAIEAWKYCRRAQPLLFLRRPIQGAQQHFPRLTMIVIVQMWGNATTTGAQ
jgi:hypothetical protein